MVCAAPAEPAQVTIHAPEGVQFPPSPNFALSPDGRYLAFAPQLGGHRLLWVQSLVTGEARALPLTEGAEGPVLEARQSGHWLPDERTSESRRIERRLTGRCRGGSAFFRGRVESGRHDPGFPGVTGYP